MHHKHFKSKIVNDKSENISITGPFHYQQVCNKEL